MVCFRMHTRAAVNHARTQSLLLAVRGAGHSNAGFATCDDGLVLDLGRLRGIRVDPDWKGRGKARCESAADPVGAWWNHAPGDFG